MKKSTFLLLYSLLGAAYIAIGENLPHYASAAVKILPIIMMAAALMVSRKRQVTEAEWLLPFIALFFSACGDVAGNIPIAQKFIKMMVFFAIAHVFYIISFARHCAPRISKGKKAVEILSLIAYVAVFSWILLPRVEDQVLKAGCICYMALLGTSCLMAILQERKGRAVMLIGIAMFIISDSLLVADKFITPVACRTVLVMGSYYIAQLLISLPLLFSRSPEGGEGCKDKL